MGGLASGLNTQDIIAKLVELERVPITRLESRKTKLNTKLNAWQEMNTRVLALKEKMDALSRSMTFDARTLTSSDDTLLKGTVTSGADAGVYYVKVNSLARAHQIRSDGEGFADTTSGIGTGTITLNTGTGNPVVITLDDTNNTLTGLRDAINRSGAGVKATIVNDGTADTPYHLLLTSTTSGTSGQMTIETSGAVPTFNTVVQAAQPASVTMGEGDGAITVQSSTNKVTGLIPGVTLDLQSADPAKTVTVTIGEDTSAAKQAIKDFVEQYNHLMDFIGKQYKYDASTRSTGALFSEPGLRSIQGDLYNKLFGRVGGLNQDIKLLTQIGISIAAGGKLTVDDSSLDDALSENLHQVRSLFATMGNASSPFVSFVSSGSNTKATGEAYAVEITAVATRARITAGVAQTEALLADEQLTINGKTINLTEGMTQADVVARINESSRETGMTASLTDANGLGTGSYLTLTRAAYGSAHTISVRSTASNGGGMASSGFGTAEVTLDDPAGEAGTGTGTAGTDVAGTINGEAATGKGQMLVGNSGNTTTDGLSLRISASAPGSYGTISVTKGIGALAAEYLDFITWPGTGTISASQNALTTMMKNIDADIAALESRVEVRRERLVLQFAQMESALAVLQSQSSQLSSQMIGWG